MSNAKVRLQGLSQSAFESNVKKALEQHTSSNVTKQKLIKNATKTILGQTTEHSVSDVFEEAQAESGPTSVFVVVFSYLNTEDEQKEMLPNAIYKTCVGEKALDKQLKEFFEQAIGDNDSVESSLLDSSIVEDQMVIYCDDDWDAIEVLKQELLDKNEALEWVLENVEIARLCQDDFLLDFNCNYAQIHWEVCDLQN